MKQVKMIFLISFAFSQFLAGCALANPFNVSPSLTPEIPTLSNEKTPSPEMSKSPTPQPTFTLTPVLTTTPLNPQDRDKLLQDLYENNGGCQLPCYWGIVPGETLWEDASAFLSSLGKIRGPGGTSKIPSYGVTFEGTDKTIRSFMPSFWVENGVVKAIGLNSSWVREDFDYSLSGLLKTFGEPEEIWVKPLNDPVIPYYDMVLLYPSKGIFVNLTGDIEKSGEDWVICPQDLFSRTPFPPQLLVWNPKIDVTFDHFGKHLVDDDLGLLTDEYRPLQEAAIEHLSNKDFYNIYIDPAIEACIAVVPTPY